MLIKLHSHQVSPLLRAISIGQNRGGPSSSRYCSRSRNWQSPRNAPQCFEALTPRFVTGSPLAVAGEHWVRIRNGQRRKFTARALCSSLSSRRATHSRDRIRVYRFLLEDELMRYLQQCVSRCFSPSSPEPPPPFLDDPPLLVGGAINAVACELERMAFIAIVGLAH